MAADNEKETATVDQKPAAAIVLTVGGVSGGIYREGGSENGGLCGANVGRGPPRTWTAGLETV